MKHSLSYFRHNVLASLLLCVILASISSGSLAGNIQLGKYVASSVTEGKQESFDKNDSIAFVKADWTKKKLGHGAEMRYAQIRMFHSIQSISLVLYPVKQYSTRILQADEAATTSDLAESVNADFAVNGSFFDTHNGKPVTFVMVDKVVKSTCPASAYDGRSNGLLAMDYSKKENRVGILPLKANTFDQIEKEYSSVLGSGPILMTDGIIPEFPDSIRHPRTIIGITNNGKDIIMVVIDGRFKGNADGMSYKECATIARYLKMKDVINLDGGGSSTLWTKTNGVINHPCDNHLFDHTGERKVSNIVYVSRIRK
ncbi:phosphodiester glycosidase family protein [Prevotella cerevisiae]|uniref:Phosphodiester glycosidase family protein n=1 Tax=Segatella cerevisiae TaxID=2053716 RepID=A0ABT1BTQ6_9BACT|nr:phosphodiester glycosidase family protein [Segatella cerevisiae]MCO6024465.1 phosphodiester glycosidase family protein [Segatella cerevisiae]